MTRFVRHLGATAAGLLLVAGLLTGCGDSSDSGGATPGTTPAPAATSANAANAACADITKIKQSSDDLQAQVGKGDLKGAQAAWATLTTAVSDLGGNLMTQGSAAAQQLHDTISSLIAGASDMNTLAKLGAVAVALKTAGPAINNAVTAAKDNLSCPG